MTRDQLYDAWTRRPFQPFVLRMPDGRGLSVPHPEFLSVAPTGRIAVVYRGEVAHVVDLYLVSDIELARPRRSRMRRRRSA